MTWDQSPTALVEITEEHHIALVQAERLRRAAHGGEEQRDSSMKSFLRFFESDAVAHFRSEEAMLLPLVYQEPEALLLAMRVMGRHMQLEAFVRKIRRGVARGAPTGETMDALAEMLEADVRFEEDSVFPAIDLRDKVQMRTVSATARRALAHP
jgi:hypothetical protein